MASEQFTQYEVRDTAAFITLNSPATQREARTQSVRPRR